MSAKGPCRRGSAKKSGTVQSAPPRTATAVRPRVGTAVSTRSGGASSKSASTASSPSVRKPIQAAAAKYSADDTCVEDDAEASVSRKMTSRARRASLGRFSDASFARPVKRSRWTTVGSSPGRNVAAEKPSHPRYTSPATFIAASETRTGRPRRARHQRNARQSSKSRMALRLAPPVHASGSGARNAAGASTRR